MLTCMVLLCHGYVDQSCLVTVMFTNHILLCHCYIFQSNLLMAIRSSYAIIMSYNQVMVSYRYVVHSNKTTAFVCVTEVAECHAIDPLR